MKWKITSCELDQIFIRRDEITNYQLLFFSVVKVKGYILILGFAFLIIYESQNKFSILYEKWQNKISSH